MQRTGPRIIGGDCIASPKLEELLTHDRLADNQAKPAVLSIDREATILKRSQAGCPDVIERGLLHGNSLPCWSALLGAAN
jgi:hypothetical protein